MKKILYIYPSYSTFIKKDITFLSDKFSVFEHNVDWTQKSKLPILFSSQLFFLLRFLFEDTKIIVMFAGYWSLLPVILGKLFNKKVFIILGGTECSNFSHLNYGSLRKPLLRWAIYWSLRWAFKLLPVHETLISSNHTYDESTIEKKQGYQSFFPSITTPFKIIHNGFDTNFFTYNSDKKISNHFITIALIQSETSFQLKGIDLIIDVASQFPNCTFTIIGMNLNVVKDKTIPKNVNFFPILSQELFLERLQQAEFYLQLSISEGFPNALCEGMLSGCIPIISNVNSLPDIINDCGFTLFKRDSQELADLLNRIIKLDKHERNRLAFCARNRINSNYPIEKRKKQFFDELS